MPFYDALHGAGLRHILVRHEQGAAFAANGYARASGRVGVCVATSGPGASNLVTGIADAMLDSVPMVVITRSEEHTSDLQSLMRISYAVFCLKKKKSETHK